MNAREAETPLNDRRGKETRLRLQMDGVNRDNDITFKYIESVIKRDVGTFSMRLR